MADGLSFNDVVSYWTNQGYSPAVARGIARGLSVETSGFNPTAFNPAGGGQGALGIGQWRGPRQRALRSLPDWQNAYTQLGFANQELNTTHTLARDVLMKARTEQEAYRAWRDYFEIGEDAHGGGGWRGQSRTTKFDPELGRDVPYVEVPGAPQLDPLDLILMGAGSSLLKPGGGEGGQQDDAAALLASFIEPPGSPQSAGTAQGGTDTTQSLPRLTAAQTPPADTLTGQPLDTGPAAQPLGPAQGVIQSPESSPGFDTTHPTGMVKPGNLDPWNRPVLHNPDGSYSTTSSMSIGTDAGEVLIPTVVNGQRLSAEEAIQHFRKTGENLGTFSTPEAADAYATALHNAQASLYDAGGTPKSQFIEPPAVGQQLPPMPAPPREQAAPFATPTGHLPSAPVTGEHPGDSALDEIMQAAGQIAQVPLGLAERAQRGAAMTPLRYLAGPAAPALERYGRGEPQIPVQPGIEKAGDVATFASGGLMSPLGVEARAAGAALQPAEHLIQSLADDAGATGRSMLADTTGAIPLPPHIQQGLVDAGKGIEKVFSPTTVDPESRYAEKIVRREVGRARRSTAQAEAQVSRRGPLANRPAVDMVEGAREPWRPLVNRYVPDFQRYIAAKQAGLNPPKPALLRFLDFIESRSTGAAYQGPPELRPLADILKKLYRQRRMAIAAEPSTSWAGFIDDYFSHSWKDPNKARQVFGATGRQGSGRNLRQRSIPTISQGIDYGLVPSTLNPIDATMAYIANMDRYLAHNRIFRIARDNGTIKFYPLGQAPQGWVQLTGRLADRAIPIGGQPPGAIRIAAHAPEGFARVYNNAVATGFLSGDLGGKLYTAALHAKNAITQSILALSGYHALAMAQEASASAFAQGIADLKEGDIAAALKQLSLGAMPLKAAQSTLSTGRKMENQYLGVEDHGPDFARVANLYAGAGGRMTGRGSEYRNTVADNYFTSFRKGAQIAEWKAGLGRVAEGNPIFAPARAIGFLGRELGRINETITAPIFDKMIPRLKAAAFFDEMHGWLKANPLATYDQQLARARMISDTIDDRFGEMVMDNIFWNARAKQTLQLLATSLGWELGSIRSIGGGITDALRGQFTPRVRYLVGLGSAIALENAAYQYIKTGQTPGQGTGGALSPGGAVDLTVPRTGGTTPEGNYERALLPGFEKDILGYLHDPLNELSGKLAGAPRMGVEALTGRDYFGHTIAPFPKFTPEWYRSWANHVFQQIRPIPLAQDRLKGSNIGMAERFAGNRPAPERWQNPVRVDRAELTRDIGELRGQLRGLWAHGARTTEERAKLNEKSREIGRQIDELARQLGMRPSPSRIYHPTPQ